MTPIVLCVTVVVIAVLLGIALAKRKRATFAEQFPPLSDAEFMARCTPGTSPEVALRVRRIVADQLAVRYEQIHPSTRFVEDLGAD